MRPDSHKDILLILKVMGS